MVFGKSWEERLRDFDEWTPCFAWWPTPVKDLDGKRVWLEWIHYKRFLCWSGSYCEYRREKPNESI